MTTAPGAARQYCGELTPCSMEPPSACACSATELTPTKHGAKGVKQMTDQDNLRNRIESIIEDKTYATAPDGFIAGTEEAAQAIIDEFGLTVVERLTEFGIDDPGYQQRVIGEWEESDEQEPRP